MVHVELQQHLGKHGQILKVRDDPSPMLIERCPDESDKPFKRSASSHCG